LCFIAKTGFDRNGGLAPETFVRDFICLVSAELAASGSFADRVRGDGVESEFISLTFSRRAGWG
jgi:hypothetical protein